MNEKEKMLRLINCASQELKAWYYEQGSEDSLPEA
jgi:hypothetical protein